MTDDDYLSYLNKSVDQYNNINYYYICKKPINADYSVLTKTIEMNPKAPKLLTELELLSIRIFFKVTLKIGQE